VVYEALEYLLHYSSTEQDKQFNQYLDYKKSTIQNAALLCLAKASRHNKILGKKYEVNQRILRRIEDFNTHEGQQRKAEIAGLLLSVGYSGNPDFDYFIEKYLKSKDDILLRYAIKAVGLSKHEVFIDQIGGLVREEKYRDEVIKALHDFGEPIVKMLFKKDEEEDLADDVRAHIPSVIESFKTRQSVVVLSHLLSSKDVVVRLNATRVLDSIEEDDHKNTIPDKKLMKLFDHECEYFKDTLLCIKTFEKALTSVGSRLSGSNGKRDEEQAARDHLKTHL
jgi:AAA family ATP:ADP antiporter